MILSYSLLLSYTLLLLEFNGIHTIVCPIKKFLLDCTLLQQSVGCPSTLVIIITILKKDFGLTGPFTPCSCTSSFHHGLDIICLPLVAAVIITLVIIAKIISHM